MTAMKVAIYDHDTEYSRKLMNYLNGKHGALIDAVAYTSREQMIQDVTKQNFDCVICEEAAGMGTIPVIRIVDEPDADGYYRYGSARDLVGRILRIGEGEKEELDGKGRFFAVYSPSNGRLRTDYAWMRAQRTQGVYVGMEEYLSIQTDRYWMEEILFLIKERDPDIGKKVKDCMVMRDGTACLPSARSYLDYRYLNYGDYHWFLEMLREESGERFVFDIGIGNLEDFRIFGLFDRIYLITEESEKEKNQMFLRLVEQELPDIREKLVFVKEQDCRDQRCKEQYL